MKSLSLILIATIIVTGTESQGAKKKKKELPASRQTKCAGLLGGIGTRRAFILGVIGLGTAGAGTYFLWPKGENQTFIVGENHFSGNSFDYKLRLFDQAARGDVFVALEGNFFDPNTEGALDDSKVEVHSPLKDFHLSSKSRVFGIENEFAFCVTGTYVLMHEIKEIQRLYKGAAKNEELERAPLDWLAMASHLYRGFPTRDIFNQLHREGPLVKKYEKLMRDEGIRAEDIDRVSEIIQEVAEGKSKITEPIRASLSRRDKGKMLLASKEASEMARDKFKDESFRKASIFITTVIAGEVYALASKHDMRAEYEIPDGLRDFLLRGSGEDKFVIEWRNQFMVKNLKSVMDQAREEGKPLYIIVGKDHAEDLEKRLKASQGNQVPLTRIDSTKPE